jgi:hypothetical protein
MNNSIFYLFETLFERDSYRNLMQKRHLAFLFIHQNNFTESLNCGILLLANVLHRLTLLNPDEQEMPKLQSC